MILSSTFKLNVSGIDSNTLTQDVLYQRKYFKDNINSTSVHCTTIEKQMSKISEIYKRQNRSYLLQHFKNTNFQKLHLKLKIEKTQNNNEHHVWNTYKFPLFSMLLIPETDSHYQKIRIIPKRTKFSQIKHQYQAFLIALVLCTSGSISPKSLS